MGEDLKNRREFLGKIRNWLVGGLYALIPLTWFSRGGGKHLFEIDIEKGPKTVQETHCNCSANTSVRVIAQHQADEHPDHLGCACTSMSAKEGTRTSSAPWACSCRGQYTRADAHAAAND